MSRLLARLRRNLPTPLWTIWQHRPMITTYDRYARRLDEVDTSAWLRGNRAAKDAHAIEARIEAGPTRLPTRVTSTGVVLQSVRTA